jgi:hypothetical protein
MSSPPCHPFPVLSTFLMTISLTSQVPVVMLDGEVLVDSSAIISRIAAEKDAEAAAAQPLPKRGWFRGGQPAQPTPSTSHTGQHATSDGPDSRQFASDGAMLSARVVCMTHSILM